LGAAVRDEAIGIGPERTIPPIEPNTPDLRTGFGQHPTQTVKERPMWSLKEQEPPIFTSYIHDNPLTSLYRKHPPI
jgi:hypothetical protein